MSGQFSRSKFFQINSNTLNARIQDYDHDFISDRMANNQYHELVGIGHSYDIVEPELGVVVHMTEPSVDHAYSARHEGAKPPFGLALTNFPKYLAMLDRDPSLIEAVNVMMAPPISQSTIIAYTPTVNKIETFCERQGYPFPHLSEPSILHFLAEGFKNDEPFSFFNKVIPSVRALETVLAVERSAITDTVKAAANSIKRKVAEKKKPVKKAFAFDCSVILDLIQKIIIPYEQELFKIKAEEFRALVRCVVIYHSFCRFSDYNILRDTDLDDQGSHIVIYFARSKNDQYYEGTSSFIPARPESAGCPVSLLRQYYRRFNLNFKGSVSTGKFLNFRITKQFGYYSAMTGTRLSQSTAVEQARSMMKKYGYDGAKYTEKSFKVGGVTALCDSGEALENVMIAGRWRNMYTPMHYRNTSVNFRLNIVQNLPIN